MKFKGKEFGLTWLSKGSKVDYKTKEKRFFITSSNGAQLVYNKEDNRDKDYEKVLKLFHEANSKIRTRILAKRFGLKVR